MIPFTTFKGILKQIPAEGMSEIGKSMFNKHFPSFYNEDHLAEMLKNSGINRVIYSSGSRVTSTGRLRRYSGGSNLPRGRYYTLCNDRFGNDKGTLINELKAYTIHNSKIHLDLIDSTIDFKSAEYIKSISNPPYEEFLTVCSFNIGIDGKPIKGADIITYKIGLFNATIDKAVDLRFPYVQDWFFKTFTELENDSIDTKFRTIKRSLINFSELLPTMLTNSIGGNTFLDAVGGWLIKNGVQALIFPSARCNINLVSDNNQIYDSSGWNLVLYGSNNQIKTNEEQSMFGTSGGWAREEDSFISNIIFEEKNGIREVRVIKI